jgi:putative hydrolase of the HAD superfamily
MLPDHVRAVCFDIGGVLVPMPRGPLAEELAGILRCDIERVRQLLIEHGKRRRTDTHTLAAVLAERCGSTRCDRVEAVLRRRVNDIAEPELFPDALPALQQLTAEGWRICFLTNAIGTTDSRPLPVYYSFAQVVVHSWEIGHCKPDLEAFRAVEHRMGLQPHEFVKVGDSPRFDMACAERAGWSTVHLARAGTPTVPSADHTITTLLDLPALLPSPPSLDRISREVACDGVD